jgi:peptide/nickel transport system ATP-binding protein
MNAVENKNLSIYYQQGRQQHAIASELNLEIHSGEIFGLVGPSGCGKSSLLRVLAGLNLNWQGDIKLLSQPLTPGKPFKPPLRQQVQMVFQDPYASLHPRHTIGRALREPLQLLGETQIDTRLREALQWVGLEADYLQRYPHQLSGGQRQRIAITSALLAQPKILLLDEPTSALDKSVQAEILNLLNQLRRQFGMTMLLVSHDADVIAHMCDRAAQMSAGQLGPALARPF